jgi:uncharacterized protein YebE (UPF0316 family)
VSLWVAVLLVFLFRLVDITLETARTILVVHEYKWVPAMVSFVEVLAWVWMFNEVIITHKSVWVYISYALGYSIGTLAGCYLGHYIVSRKGK